MIRDREQSIIQQAKDAMLPEPDMERLSKIERVNVIGTSGSGKSTFGRQLATRLGVPFVEMDAVYWGPDWTEPSDEAFIPKIKAIADGSHWVLDGNYSRTTAVKWRQVQLEDMVQDESGHSEETERILRDWPL